jgi:hypothetical protein
MIYVSTLFDHSKDSRPLYTIIYDSQLKTSEAIPLWISGSGITIYEIGLNVKKVAVLVGNKPIICINDYKQHLIAFNVDYQSIIKAYDYPSLPGHGISKAGVQKFLVSQIKSMIDTGLNIWNLVRGSAAPAYRDLQTRGVIYGYSKVYPIWSMDTYSGRTKTSGFSIQGLEEDAPISNVSPHGLFVSFDWVSADFRMAAVLSGDRKLADSYLKSDPYQFLADSLKNDQLEMDRDTAKIQMLGSLYSLNYNSTPMQFYMDLGAWMRRCVEHLEKIGSIESIFGRVYKVEKDRDIKSAFNAIIQGSIAIAMQRTIRRVWELAPSNLLTENHDGIIMTFNERDPRTIVTIKQVAKIMSHPFSGILDDDPVFPVSVSTGKKYKIWTKTARFK